MANSFIKRKIEDEFGNAISAAEKKAIATLIYYPEQKLEQVLKTGDAMRIAQTDERYHEIIYGSTKNEKLVQSLNNLREGNCYSFQPEDERTGDPEHLVRW